MSFNQLDVKIFSKISKLQGSGSTGTITRSKRSDSVNCWKPRPKLLNYSKPRPANICRSGFQEYVNERYVSQDWLVFHYRRGIERFPSPECATFWLSCHSRLFGKLLNDNEWSLWTLLKNILYFSMFVPKAPNIEEDPLVHPTSTKSELRIPLSTTITSLLASICDMHSIGISERPIHNNCPNLQPNSSNFAAVLYERRHLKRTVRLFSTSQEEITGLVRETIPRSGTWYIFTRLDIPTRIYEKSRQCHVGLEGTSHDFDKNNTDSQIANCNNYRGNTLHNQDFTYTEKEKGSTFSALPTCKRCITITNYPNEENKYISVCQPSKCNVHEHCLNHSMFTTNHLATQKRFYVNCNKNDPTNTDQKTSSPDKAEECNIAKCSENSVPIKKTWKECLKPSHIKRPMMCDGVKRREYYKSTSKCFSKPKNQIELPESCRQGEGSVPICLEERREHSGCQTPPSGDERLSQEQCGDSKDLCSDMQTNICQATNRLKPLKGYNEIRKNLTSVGGDCDSLESRKKHTCVQNVEWCKDIKPDVHHITGRVISRENGICVKEYRVNKESKVCIEIFGTCSPIVNIYNQTKQTDLCLNQEGHVDCQDSICQKVSEYKMKETCRNKSKVLCPPAPDSSVSPRKDTSHSFCMSLIEPQADEKIGGNLRSNLHTPRYEKGSLCSMSTDHFCKDMINPYKLRVPLQSTSVCGSQFKINSHCLKYCRQKKKTCAKAYGAQKFHAKQEKQNDPKQMIMFANRHRFGSCRKKLARRAQNEASQCQCFPEKQIS